MDHCTAVCPWEAADHNESATLSMNLAILASRLDSPPQSWVVSVIWTCGNTNTASAFPTPTLRSHKQRPRALARHQQGGENRKTVKAETDDGERWAVAASAPFLCRSDSAQLLGGFGLVADPDTGPGFGFCLAQHDEDAHGRRARSLLPTKELQLKKKKKTRKSLFFPFLVGVLKRI